MADVPPRRLYRSRRDRMVSGVSGGLGYYFDVDPTLVRLLWVLATIFTGGLAIIAYVILWIITPEGASQGARPGRPRETWQAARPEGAETPAEQREASGLESSGAAPGGEEHQEAISATSYDAAPEPTYEWAPTDRDAEETRDRRRKWAAALLIAIGLFFLAGNLNLFWWLDWRIVWPVALIAVGVLLLWNRARE